MTVCIGETLAQLPDRAQRLTNWATAALAIGAGIHNGSGAGDIARTSSGSSLGTITAMNKIKNNTGNSTASGGVFFLSQLRELPHVLVVNEWGLHHHR